MAICTDSRTGEHLATFTRRPVSGLYTLTTESGQVAGQVAASVEVAASCSCRLLTHGTLLWHHCLVHPSLPRLRGMHSRLLVSSLPRSLLPLPRSLAPPCLPCVEGRQRAAPHSSSFPPTTTPLQTLHMDVWSPARVTGQGGERYFLLVVDDYTRYTTVFPFQSKADVRSVLIRWIRAVRRQLSARFRQDLLVLRLHSDRGGEFCSRLLEDFCGAEGIRQSFKLPASPQQNGIAERRIGLVMEVARTSIVHAAAPHFLWPFAVRYAAEQLNLWPRVSHTETSPTLRWTGGVGDGRCFRVLLPQRAWRPLLGFRLGRLHRPCSQSLWTLVLLEVVTLGVQTLGVLVLGGAECPTGRGEAGGAAVGGAGGAGAGDTGVGGAGGPGARDASVGGTGARRQETLSLEPDPRVGCPLLVLEVLGLLVLEVLELLVLEVLELEVLEVLELLVLVVLELEVLEVLELLVLEVLELEVLEVLEVVVLEVLELLEVEVLEVLELLTSQPQLLPGSPRPAPSPYPAQTGSLAERREPESRPASPVRLSVMLVVLILQLSPARTL
ncbi:unnamed protein product [Closterium sp. Naga37s-1]|nr:unnamed protein product [Closterium sp. Naga37s-1]